MISENYYDKNRLEKSLINVININDLNKVLGAYEIAEVSLMGLIDNNGMPKFYHTTRLAMLLIEELEIKETDLIIASLLHNIHIHNKEITQEILNFNFGTYVTYLVQLLTDEFLSRNNSEIEFDLNKADDDGLLIILSDILDEIRSYDSNMIFDSIKIIENLKNKYFKIAEQRNNPKINYLLKQLKIERNKIIG